MKKYLSVGNVLGIFILVAIAWYAFSISAQKKHVQEICDRYSNGAIAPTIASIEARYSVQVMGPMSDSNTPDTTSYIFCSPLTMCDVSCRIEIVNGTVTNAEYAEL